METLHSEMRQGFRCVIVQDDFPQSPREWDNLSTFSCVHLTWSDDSAEDVLRYSDSIIIKHALREFGLGEKWDNREGIGIPCFDYYKQPPVLFTVTYGEYHELTWEEVPDLTQKADMDLEEKIQGVFYVTKEAILKEYGKEGDAEVTSEMIEAAKKCTISEMEVMREFLEGRVYSVFIYAHEESDWERSLHGIYEDFNNYALADGFPECLSRCDEMIEEIKLSAGYARLPKDAREYMERTIGLVEGESVPPSIAVRLANVHKELEGLKDTVEEFREDTK